MKTLLAFACLLSACATPKKHHTPKMAAPSVEPVRASISEAEAASRETSRHLSTIKRGTNRVDYKAGRALEYFQ